MKGCTSRKGRVDSCLSACRLVGVGLTLYIFFSSTDLYRFTQEDACQADFLKVNFVPLPVYEL